MMMYNSQFTFAIQIPFHYLSFCERAIIVLQKFRKPSIFFVYLPLLFCKKNICCSVASPKRTSDGDCADWLAFAYVTM